MDILLPGVGSQTNAMGMDEVEALQKALTAGYGTDVSTFSGGSALRIQSLDTTMKSTIQTNDQFKLFNNLPKPKATATVDEWTERNGIGGFLGGTTNTETGTIREAGGSYNRRVGLVKYLMTKASVSLISTLGNNLASSETVENEAAALRLLTDCEFLSFEGDSTVVPTEFDGIFHQLEDGITNSQVDGGNIVDCQGLSLASIHKLNLAAAQIAGFGNFGRPTHIYCSQQVQADFDNNLDPAFRVPLPNIAHGGLMLGAPVSGIRTSHGDIAMVNDVFVRDEPLQYPFDIAYPAVATANAALQPASAVPGSPASDANSMFTALHAGNYYYAVAGLTADGQSTALVTAQVAIAAGQKVAITITKSAGNLETGYAIYRGRLNGTNALADMRLVRRIPKAGNTTIWTDYNKDMPGTSKAYVLNMGAGADAIAWRQLMPMLKFQLYPTDAAILPWSQLLFGFLRIAKRRQHVVLKNIVPSGAVWRPFN
jgi:hypothetical protein